jgi:hypothetical protein
MKKSFIVLTIALLAIVGMANHTYAASSVSKFYDPAVIYYEGFENSTDITTYDHLYTGHEAEILTDGALSGSYSLTTYITSAPGQWVDTLSIKKDFTQIEGANAFLVSGKIKTSNYQQMMVEVRKNYDGNAVENMPYEFILQFDETAKTISRPCWAGWYNACTTLNIFNEEYKMSNEGVIDFQFEFSSSEPVTITFRGVIKNLAEVAMMTFDDITVAEKPIITEDFEFITGNFWEDTAFWANAGGIETNPDKVISGLKSLRYDITAWALGGLTNTKAQPPKEVPLRLSFDIRAENGKVFQLAAPWSPLYFEFEYNFETNALRYAGIPTASAVLENGVLHAEMEFTIPASVDMQNFNFYGDRINAEAAGFFYIDNFEIEVLVEAPIVIPTLNVGYAITLTEELAYRTNVLANEFTALKNEAGETVAEENYVVMDHEFKFVNAYLDTFEAKMGNVFTLETTKGNFELLVDIYDIRAEVDPMTVLYNKALNQNVEFEVDLNDQELVQIKLGDTVLQPANYTMVETALTLKNTFLSTLAVGEYQLLIETTGGSRFVDFEIVAGLAAFPTQAFDFTKGTNTNVEVAHNIDLSIIESFTTAEVAVAEADYTVNATTLTLNAAYLNTLAIGEHVFTVETATDGVEFTFTITVIALAPTVTEDELTFDVNVDDSLEIAVDLKGMPLTEVRFNDVSTTLYTYASGMLTLNKSLLENLPLGDQSIEIETDGGMVEVTVTVENSAELNDVITITVTQATVTIEKGATFNALANVVITNNVGTLETVISSHHDLDVSGRYIVTIVATDTQDNVSFAYYILVVSGSEYTVAVTFDLILTERGAIDEAILDSNRKYIYNV